MIEYSKLAVFAEYRPKILPVNIFKTNVAVTAVCSKALPSVLRREIYCCR